MKRFNKPFMGHSIRPILSHVHKFETKLENQIQGLVTDVVDLPNNNIQKFYVPPVYQDELDIKPKLVNLLPSPSEPTKFDLDAAYKAFKKCLETKEKNHLELARLELSQEKFDVYVNQKCLEELQSYQSGGIEVIGSQVIDNLKKENLSQIDFEYLEQQQVVDDLRFRKMDNYINQQIEAGIQKHLEESLKFVENHLNSLKTGKLKENLNNIGFEPIKPTTNHLPLNGQGFVYAGVVPGRPPVYLGKDSVTDFSGNDGDGFEPPGNGGNGGSNGPGDDDFPDGGPDSPGIGYFALMLLFWGTLLSTFKIIYSFVSSFIIDKLNFNSLNLLDILEKMFGKEQIEEDSPAETPLVIAEPPTVTARRGQEATLVPLLVASTGLVAWSYLLSPENLLRCLNLFFNLSAMLGRSLGRILLYVIPQPLQAVAILLGNGVAQVFSFTRRVLIPAIMLSRTLMVLGLKLYVLLKLATFGVELCRLFSILSPSWLKKGAQQAVEAVESSNQIEPTSSITESPFLFGFLKSLLVFLLPFIPLPENKGIKLAGWALFIYLVNGDTVYINLFIEKLLEVPEVVKLISCILGRFACVFIAINISKDLKEPDSKAITWLFYGSLYYYKVFGLALSASSNLLPV